MSKRLGLKASLRHLRQKITDPLGLVSGLQDLLEIFASEKQVTEKQVDYLVGQDVIKIQWRAELDEQSHRGSLLAQVLELNGQLIGDQGERIYFWNTPEKSQLKELSQKIIEKFGLINTEPVAVSAGFSRSHIRNLKLRQRLEERI